MADLWSPWAVGGAGQFRLGVTLTPQSEDAAAKVVRAHVFFQGSGGAGDSTNTFGVGGGTWSRTPGSIAISAGAGAEVLLWYQDVTIYKTYGAEQNVTIDASLSGLEYYGTGTTAHLPDGIFHTVAARPWDAPSAATGVSAARSSDASHTVSYTVVASGTAPVTERRVQRWDNVTNAWATIAVLPGAFTANSAQSYIDGTTVANRQYKWRVVTANSTAEATSGESSLMQTTPAAPSNLNAVRSGANIALTWDRNVSTSMAVAYEVYDSQNGGAYALVTTLGDVATYTHPSPSLLVTHRYQVRAVSTVGATTASAVATSQTVQLTAPPNAPSSLTSSPATVPAAETTRLSYQHNPTDSSSQTKRQFRHRAPGAPTWTNLAAQSTSLTYLDIALAAWGYANGQSPEWQVRTWGTASTGGSDGTGASPWSATAVTALSSRPTATISAPGSLVTTSQVVAAWTFYDAEGSAQAEWQARLKDSGGVVLETLGAASAASSAVFGTRVADGQDYTLEVRVKDAVGLWSTWAVHTFSVAYLPAERIDIAALYDEPSGAMQLVLTPQGAEAGVTVAAVSATIERRVDGGAWETVAAGIEPASTAVDPIPTITRLNEYRVIATSAIPSTSVGDVEPIEVTGVLWVFVNYGPGFGAVLRVRGNLGFSDEATVAQAAYHFEDRPKEVAFWGTAESRTMGLTADLDAAASDLDEWLAAAKFRGAVFARDPRGTRIRGRLSAGVKNSQTNPASSTLGLTVSEIDG